VIFSDYYKCSEAFDWYKSAVTAPILLPQMEYSENLKISSKNLRTECKSSYSANPKVTISPSDLPLPLKSTVKSARLLITKCYKYMQPSILEPAFPCK